MSNSVTHVTCRDWFAGVAMTALLDSAYRYWSEEHILHVVRLAYRVADAMMVVRDL